MIWTRMLVRALESRSETCRTVAGMLLTRGGERAERLLLEALERSGDVLVIQVLGSMGNPGLAARLRPYALSGDPEVAEAAAEAIRALEP